MQDQHGQKGDQIVRPRHRETEFFKKGFQIFLGRLLAEEATLVRQTIAFERQLLSGAMVGLGLLNPLACGPLHKALAPCS